MKKLFKQIQRVYTDFLWWAWTGRNDYQKLLQELEDTKEALEEVRGDFLEYQEYHN